MKDRFDRVDLTMERSDGALASYFFATAAPGLIQAQMAVIKGDDGSVHAASEPRIQAYWLKRRAAITWKRGCRSSLVGCRLWVEARDW